MNLPPKIMALMEQGAFLMKHHEAKAGATTTPTLSSASLTKRPVPPLPTAIPRTAQAIGTPPPPPRPRAKPLRQTSVNSRSNTAPPVKPPRPERVCERVAVAPKAVAPPPPAVVVVDTSEVDALREHCGELESELLALQAFCTKIKNERANVTQTVESMAEGYAELKESSKKDQEQMRALYLSQRVIQEHVEDLEGCYQDKTQKLTAMAANQRSEDTQTVDLRVQLEEMKGALQMAHAEREAAVSTAADHKGDMIKLTEQLLELAHKCQTLEIALQNSDSRGEQQEETTAGEPSQAAAAIEPPTPESERIDESPQHLQQLQMQLAAAEQLQQLHLQLAAAEQRRDAAEQQARQAAALAQSQIAAMQQTVSKQKAVAEPASILSAQVAHAVSGMSSKLAVLEESISEMADHATGKGIGAITRSWQLTAGLKSELSALGSAVPGCEASITKTIPPTPVGQLVVDDQQFLTECASGELEKLVLAMESLIALVSACASPDEATVTAALQRHNGSMRDCVQLWAKMPGSLQLHQAAAASSQVSSDVNMEHQMRHDAELAQQQMMVKRTRAIGPVLWNVATINVKRVVVAFGYWSHRTRKMRSKENHKHVTKAKAAPWAQPTFSQKQRTNRNPSANQSATFR